MKGQIIIKRGQILGPDLVIGKYSADSFFTTQINMWALYATRNTDKL